MLETRRVVTFVAERLWNCVLVKKTRALTVQEINGYKQDNMR